AVREVPPSPCMAPATIFQVDADASQPSKLVPLKARTQRGHGALGSGVTGSEASAPGSPPAPAPASSPLLLLPPLATAPPSPPVPVVPPSPAMVPPLPSPFTPPVPPPRAP